MAPRPPVDLDFDVDLLLEDLPDLAGQLHLMRAHGPAVWARAFGQPSLMLLGHELVREAFRDEATFPAADFYEATVTEVMGRNLQCMRGDEHRTNRALVSPAFRARLMPGYIEPLLEPVAHELIDRFVDSGRADLVADFTSIYPFVIITRLLGLPRHAEDEVRHWALGMLDVASAHYDAMACSRAFVAFVEPILEHRRVEPGDDLISTLATTEIDGTRLSDEEIFNFLRLLFPAGADTTYLGLGNTLWALLTDRTQLELVLADPADGVRRAGEEGIRLNPPVAWIPRLNRHDRTWHGIDIPGGTPIHLGVMAANRDPSVHRGPDRFDINRDNGAVMTFGFGTHFCLGAHLARAELEVALRVLLTRLPDLRLETTDDVRITGTIHQLLRGPNRLPVRFD